MAYSAVRSVGFGASGLYGWYMNVLLIRVTASSGFQLLEASGRPSSSSRL
jgi:hypothetical protein